MAQNFPESYLIREKASRGTIRETKRTYLQIKKDYENAKGKAKDGNGKNVKNDKNDKKVSDQNLPTKHPTLSSNNLNTFTKKLSQSLRPKFKRSLTATERLKPRPKNDLNVLGTEVNNSKDENNNEVDPLVTISPVYLRERTFVKILTPSESEDELTGSESFDNLDKNILELQKLDQIFQSKLPRHDPKSRKPKIKKSSSLATKHLPEQDLGSMKASDLFTSKSFSSKLSSLVYDQAKKKIGKDQNNHGKDQNNETEFREFTSKKPNEIIEINKIITPKMPNVSISTPPAPVRSNEDFILTHSSLASLPVSKSSFDREIKLKNTIQNVCTSNNLTNVKKLASNFEPSNLSKSNFKNKTQKTQNSQSQNSQNHGQNDQNDQNQLHKKSSLLHRKKSTNSICESSTFDFNANTASQVNLNGLVNSIGEESAPKSPENAFNYALMKMEKDKRISKWLSDI